MKWGICADQAFEGVVPAAFIPAFNADNPIKASEGGITVLADSLGFRFVETPAHRPVMSFANNLRNPSECGANTHACLSPSLYSGGERHVL